MTPKLVIFDCDGVLVDTETITSGVMVRNFARYGLQTTVQEMHQFFVGGTMMSASEEARRRGAELPPDWLAIITEEVNDELSKGVDVFEGVFDLLDTLDARGISTAIASNGPLVKMRVSLGPSGLWERFDGRIFSGRAHNAPKPAPGMLIAACDQAGVAPKNAVMIDDTTAGTRAADAAGMRAIGFAAASDAESLRATGHPIAMTMEEVSGYLGL